jgi:peptide subunit release factor 1 (eRF1)
VKNIREVLQRLARVESGAPVVSVYLNTEWVDEHQRERVRVFLKNHLREARDAGGADPGDLDWIEAQGVAVVDQVMFPDANGVALFASTAAGLREILPVRVPFDDAFVVEARPYLRPLAQVADETPAALIVFADGTSARLVLLDATGPEDEILLKGDVPGRHKTGGWAALAQSRYQRHIQAHRDQHLEAVAEAITAWSEQQGAERVVLAGEPRMVAAVRRHLPQRVAARVVGSVTGTRWEAAGVLAARAAALLTRMEAAREDTSVDAVLTDAADSFAVVAGLDATLEAVNRDAVLELYVLDSFHEAGAHCSGCGVLQRRFHFTCSFCGKELHSTELGGAMVSRVLTSGGRVITVEHHAGLAGRGGVAARLRYTEMPAMEGEK